MILFSAIDQNDKPLTLPTELRKLPQKARVAVDLTASRAIALITLRAPFALGNFERLSAELGTLTKTLTSIQSPRMGTIGDTHTVQVFGSIGNFEEGALARYKGISFRSTGIVPVDRNALEDVADLPDTWKTLLLRQPEERQRVAHEAYNAVQELRNGTSPEAKARNAAEKVLLRAYTGQVGGAFVQLPMGSIVGPGAVLDELEKIRHPLGQRGDAPVAIPLQPGQMRMFGSFSAALDDRGFLTQFRDGQVVDGVDEQFVEQLRRAGARFEYMPLHDERTSPKRQKVTA